MSILTDKAKSELILSIISFLNENNLSESANMLEKESDLNADKKYNGILERKWITVARLQKKCMDLEKNLSELQSEIDKNVFRKKQKFEFTPLPKQPCRYILEGHQGAVHNVAVHPKATVIATCGQDCVIKIYDYETGEFERNCKGHTRPVLDLVYSHSGEVLASCGEDTLIKLWDVLNDYACTKTIFAHDKTISSVIFHPNDKTLFSASRDNLVKAWDVASGVADGAFMGHSSWVRCLAIHEDGKLLASSGNDNHIKVWEVDTKNVKYELFGHEHVVEALMFLPKLCIRDSMELLKTKESFTGILSASRDKTIRIWNVEAQECLFSFLGHTGWIRSICIQYADLVSDFQFPSYILSASEDKTIRVFVIHVDLGYEDWQDHKNYRKRTFWVYQQYQK